MGLFFSFGSGRPAAGLMAPRCAGSFRLHHPALAIRLSAAPERRFWKNFSTSRDSVSAVSVRLLAAVSTEAAAVSVSPMASRSEVMLATRVSLPCAADWARSPSHMPDRLPGS